MDPVSASVSMNAVVQALLLRQGLQPADVEALFQAVGQELSVLFLAQNTEGAQLQLPSGQIVTAQGELPFPPGTQLQVRVEAEAGQLKLQTLEARPPAPPAVLAPLVQGEAVAFMARLSQGAPPSELAPLVQLLRTLGGLPEPAALPSAAPLQTAIQELPPEQRLALAQALELPEGSPEGLATRLATLAEPTRTTSGNAISPSVDSPRSPVAAAEVLARFQVLLAKTDLPPELRNALDGWIRGLLTRKAPEAQAAPLPTATRRGQEAQAVVESRLLAAAETTRAGDAVRAHGGPASEVPEAWETWLKGSIRALADPAVSPREAPFHALQGKDGSAFFEIPVPWAGSRPLQIWVEEEGREGKAGEEIRRVLLALNLSRLGETRVGLQSAGNSLSVRIWTEHPDRVESLQADMEKELGESGRAVDLRIFPLNPGPDGRIPDLRSLVGGANLHALG